MTARSVKQFLEIFLWLVCHEVQIALPLLKLGG